MVRLHILAGTKAGVKYDAATLPVSVGRSGHSDIELDDPGVWPCHCKILWLEEGLVLESDPEATAYVNNIPVPRAVLRNGDLITLGGATMRFGLSPVHQSSAALREWLTWIALALLCLGQVALIYRICQ